jgi:hypothetical protein
MDCFWTVASMQDISCLVHQCAFESDLDVHIIESLECTRFIKPCPRVDKERIRAISRVNKFVQYVISANL